MAAHVLQGIFVELGIISGSTVFHQCYVVIIHIGISGRRLHADIGRHAGKKKVLNSFCVWPGREIRVDKGAVAVLERV